MSAALTVGSPSAQAFDHVESRGVFLCSGEVLAELKDVLARPKFDRWVSLEGRARFLHRYQNALEMVAPQRRIEACRDPDDDRILEVAVTGVAEFIVTGDRDLLVLDPFRGIRIVTPRGLLEMVRGG